MICVQIIYSVFGIRLTDSYEYDKTESFWFVYELFSQFIWTRLTNS